MKPELLDQLLETEETLLEHLAKDRDSPIALCVGAGNLGLHAARPAHVPAESPRYLVAAAGLLASVIALIAARGM